MARPSAGLSPVSAEGWDTQDERNHCQDDERNVHASAGVCIKERLETQGLAEEEHDEDVKLADDLQDVVERRAIEFNIDIRKTNVDFQKVNVGFIILFTKSKYNMIRFF